MKLAVTLAALTLSTSAIAGPFTLSSTDIKPNSDLANTFIYKGFGCEGDNISPQLSWSGAPEGTQSFAITVYDPDAPTGSGWWHWMVVNVPADTTALAQGASSDEMPNAAIQVETDYGEKKFGGACPPAGDDKHRYQFKVHALKVAELDVTADTPAALVGYMINANSLGTAQFTAYYQR